MAYPYGQDPMASYGAYQGSAVPAPYQGSAMAMGGPPAVGNFNPEVGGNVPAIRGPGIPGARYAGAVQDPESGTIIDRYVVPKREAIPVQKRVPEVQEFMTYSVMEVPETRSVQVPVERMVPREETVMVPRVKMVPVREMVPQTVTKMVPQTFMTEQQFTVRKPVRVPQRQQRTIMKVFEGQKIIETKEVLEYERPRLIPGRYRGKERMEPAPVGVEWKHAYYQGDARAYGEQYAGAQYQSGQGYADPYFNPGAQYQTYEGQGGGYAPQYGYPEQGAAMDPATGRQDAQFSGPARGAIN